MLSKLSVGIRHLRVARWRGWLLLTLSLIVVGCNFANPNEQGAEDSAESSVSEEYVTEFLKYAETNAKDVHLKPETERLQRMKDDTSEIHLFPGKHFSVKDPELRNEFHNALAKLIQDSSDPYVTGTQTANAAVAAELVTLVKHWKSIRTQLADRQQELFEARATTKVQGQVATLLSMDNSRFWVFFAVAIGGLIVVVLHERRHALRSFLNGGAPHALGLTSVLSVVSVGLLALLVSYFFFGNALYEFALEIGTGEESPRSAARAKLAVLKKQHAKTVKDVGQIDKEFDAAIKGVSSRLSRELKFARPVVDQWERNRKHIAAGLVNLDVEAAIAKSLSADLLALEKVEQQLENEKDKSVGYGRLKRKIRFGLGFFLLLVTVSGIYMFDHGARKRLRSYSDTCPLCLKESFKDVPLRTTSESERRCTNTLEDGLTCEFHYKDIYRRLPKLCFATLGHPASGKTMWLMFCYRQLKHRQKLPKNVYYEGFNDDSLRMIETLLRDFLENEGEPPATDAGRMPRPLLFNFRDQDPWGPSQEFLSIFDFSGEIGEADLGTHDAKSIQRERALQSNGYFYFLDPTIIQSDIQMDSLIKFRDDIRDFMQLRPGDQVRTPVALCLSKVDLLGNMPYGDPDGFVGNFYRDLAAIDNDKRYRNDGKEITMEKIQRRSDLVRELIPQIWEDWDIEEEIKNLFGRRIMFFPMTPIGMGKPFKNDISSIEGRKPNPYEILAPMLWMVHMTGHLVLDDMSKLSRIVKVLNPLLKNR